MISKFISMLFSFLSCIFLTTFASSKPSKCSYELEQVLYKPFVCGVDYFQRIEEKFMTLFRGPIVDDPAQISTFCQKFSAENDVTVNILNQNGIDMCDFRNPTASLLITLYSLLNTLSQAQRNEFYYPFSLLKNPPVPTNDVAGSYYFLIYLAGYTEQEVQGLLNVYINELQQVVSNGTQPTQFVTDVTTIVTIMSSIPTTDLPQYLGDMEHLKSVLNDPNSISITFLFTTIYGFPPFPRLKSTLTPLTPYPLNLNLSNQIILLLNLIGTFGIVKNFATLLTINLIQEGICYWAYTHFFGTSGTVYRIVFSQQTENLLYK